MPNISLLDKVGVQFQHWENY